MMQYVILIYGNEAAYAAMTPEEQQADFQAYMDFTANITKRGVYKGGDALMPTNSATTVRVANAKTVITDGPFAETKEQLAGYYVIECKDLEEAIEIAALCPAAKYGSVEVRPIMAIPQAQ
jgi:hypothetical protein